MSGMISSPGVSEFVYVELKAGLKVQRGSKEMQESAAYENQRRIDLLDKKSDALAKKVRLAIIDFAESRQSTGAFHPISDGYRLYKKGMAGYKRFPTFSTDEEAVEHAGRDCYFLMTEDPIGVVRFSKLPDKALLDSMKKVVGKTIAGEGQTD